MNHIFKIVWCSISQTWVVASELAKSSGKGKACTVSAVSLLTIALTASAFGADLTGDLNTPYQITNGDPILNIKDATFTPGNITSGTRYFGVASTNGSNKDVIINIKNLTIKKADDNPVISDGMHTAIRAESTNGSATIALEGTNSIALGVQGDTAVLVRASGVGNEAKITVKGELNIDNKGTYIGYERDGLESNGYDGANSVIDHQGTGTINVIAGNAVFSKVYGTTGNSFVTLKGAGGKNSIVLNTTGNSSGTRFDGTNGISASIRDPNNITGTINIDTDARITTSGTYSHGIYTQSQGGDVAIANGGDIKVTGNSSIGIRSEGKNANHTIINTGDITASGDNGSAIYVVGVDTTVLDGSSTGVVNIQDLNNSKIQASIGGIIAYGGAVNIESNSEINLANSISGAITTVGVDAFSANKSGNATIKYDGTQNGGITIVSSGTGDARAIGLRATNSLSKNGLNSKSDAIVIASGDISVTQSSSGNARLIYGIEAASHNAGDAYVEFSKGKIDLKLENGSSVDFGRGIVAQSAGQGNVIVKTKKGTEIHTSGDLLQGIALSGISNTNGSLIYGDINSQITTSGTGSHAITVNASGTIDTELHNGEALTTKGRNSHGIYVKNDGTGAVTIVNKGDITTLNETPSTGGTMPARESHAILVNGTNTGETGDIDILVEDSKLQTSAYDSSGIRVVRYGSKGNTNITLKNSIINLNGKNSDGIIVHQTNDAINGYQTDINITTIGGGINLLQAPVENTDGAANFGIVATQTKNAMGNINIVNVGTGINIGLGGSGSTIRSGAIYATFSDVGATGSINIQNSGALQSKSNDWSVIRAAQAGLGDIKIINTGSILADGDNDNAIGAYISNANSMGQIFITNSGNLTTNGTRSHGVIAENNGTGKTTISNTGNIITQAAESNGIRVNSNGGLVEIQNSGDITTNGTNSHGIRVDPADGQEIVIHNDGTLKLDGATSRGIIVRQTNANDTKVAVVNNGTILQSDTGAGKYGIEVNGLNNSNIEINHNGVIKGGGIGIVAWSGFVDHTGGTSIINIGSSGVVEAHNAVTADMSKSNTVNIAHGGLIDAYNGGVLFRGQNSLDAQSNVLNNAGTILSDTDKVIVGNNLKANSTTAINNLNSGVITGTMTFSGGDVTVNNDGVWNLRSFTDTNNDRIRDTKNVAISNFGSGNNIINNTGTIKLVAVDDTGVTINPIGEYVPHGALSSINGIEHGQLLGVKEFNHSAVLDLRGSGSAGNVLVISGGNTAGADGGGVFTSNGGIMNVTTLLNQGGIDSRSDMLVVDNIKLGSGATKIDVAVAAGSQDLPTVDSGIQIVKTLDTQDAGSFTLLKPVTYGRYEYLLFGDDANGNADGYYLRNKLNDTGGDNGYIDPPIYLPNPNIGAYLGNQYAAANMFNQNILDRRDNVRAPDQTIWGRIQYNEMKTEHMRNTQKLSIDNTLIQLGADLYQDLEKGHIAGVYVGYGKSEIKNRSRLTGTEAKGSVEGLQIGAYYSWMPQEDQGPYVDIWGHYAHFTNKLKGDAQRGMSKKYKGYGLALSAETGYGFVLSEDASKKWILEPHAQITYNYLNMDSFTDHNNTRFSNNKGKGFDLRLGARLYGYHPENNGLLPYVELNWLHNGMSNGVSVNGSRENSRIGRNVGELKLGFQGNLSKESSIFAYVGYEKGSNRYHRTKFQIGFNYNW